MSLNIKDPETERLAGEVARLAGETKTRAVKVALLQRQQALMLRAARPDRRSSLLELLEHEVWPQVPTRALGKAISRAEREEILGYGPEGI